MNAAHSTGQVHAIGQAATVLDGPAGRARSAAAREYWDLVQDVRQRVVAVVDGAVVSALLLSLQDGDILHADVDQRDERLETQLPDPDARFVQSSLDGLIC